MDVSKHSFVNLALIAERTLIHSKFYCIFTRDSCVHIYTQSLI